MPAHSEIARPLAHRSVSDLVLGSVLTGLIAGLAMALLTFALFAVAGQGVDVPLRIVASTFGPGWALTDGHPLAPAVLGLLIHFAVSVAWALAFAAAFGRISTRKAIAWGLVWGLGASVLMRFVVLPSANPLLALSPRWSFFAVHALYGLSLGLLPWSVRIAGRSARGPSRPPARRAGPA